MGQCYSNYLLLKVKDEQGAIKALQDKIANSNGYGVEDARKAGVDTNTLYGLLQVFFGDWERGYRLTTEPNTWKGFVKYSSWFDAAYMWENVMIETFSEIAPFLADRSSLKIYPDSGVDYMRVKDGKAEWIR